MTGQAVLLLGSQISFQNRTFLRLGKNHIKQYCNDNVLIELSKPSFVVTVVRIILIDPVKADLYYMYMYTTLCLSYSQVVMPLPWRWCRLCTVVTVECFYGAG